MCLKLITTIGYVYWNVVHCYEEIKKINTKIEHEKYVK